MSKISSREEALFADALAQPRAQRGAFLTEACGEDAALLARLAALVAAHEGSESLMASSEAARPPHALEEKPGDVIARYKLLQKIGEGGCGVVWMAEQEEPVRRRVALKVIKLGMDTKAVVARFEAERQALAMMDHPNIAKVHDAGSTDTGRPYFVMELVRGIPITKYCDENHLTPKERLELFIKVCQAIQHAHQKGVIHRDIKPSNILVTVNDGAPTPKVIDFGIAKATQGKLTDATVFTAFEQFIGTPVYMSPEQAEMTSLDIDTRSDIYSLGVLLYELLTGRPPFDPKVFAQAGVDQIRQQIREVEPAKPSRRLGTMDDGERTTIAKLRNTAPAQLSILLRGDLDWIVMRCLEKDRTRRYDTANGLAMDIQRHLRNEPVTARPPSSAYLLQKLIRRNRVAFAGAVAVTIVLMVGAVVSRWQAVRATQAELAQIRLRSESEQARERAQAAETAARRAEETASAGRARSENLMAFIFTSLGEQLSDYGQFGVCAQMSEKAIAYYEKLPPELQTREARAAHAFALAGVGGALSWVMMRGESVRDRWHNPDRKARLDRALRIFESLLESGDLSPFMRVAFAAVAKATADQYDAENRIDEGLSLCERAEEILPPALGDEEWGGWAQHALTTVLNWRAYFLRRQGRVGGERAIPVMRAALASAAEADRRSHGSRSGLRVALLKPNFAAALFANPSCHNEANQVVSEARRELRGFIDREPTLVSVRQALGWAETVAAALASEHWRLSELVSAQQNALAQYSELANLLPDEWFYNKDLTPLLVGWESLPVPSIASVYGYHWGFGDFAAGETNVRRAVDVLSVEWAPPDSRRKLVMARAAWARICAATGRDDEADRQLAAMEMACRRLIEDRKLSPIASEISLVGDGLNNRCQVEFHRLRWQAMRTGAEQALQRLGALLASPGDERQVRQLMGTAYGHFLTAAFEMGDYTTARNALREWNPNTGQLARSATIHARFEHLGVQLTRIVILARAGETSDARAALNDWWPEVEAILAAGPDYLFNRVQTARALAIKAEIMPLETTEKRALLTRAASYMPPATDANRLTRYEREVLLAGIEKQLAALIAAETP